MSITGVDTDWDHLTVTVIADFDAPVERVWELWANPRKLERWWGPPTYPATFETHDLVPGGEVTYFMTGPEGDRYGGMWRITATFESREDLENWLSTGTREGQQQAIAQMDVLLAP